MRATPKLVIVDYGVGNLQSLGKAVKLFTDQLLVSEDPQEISQADGLILPGVGAFEAGMSGLGIRGLIQTVKKFAESRKPILGICLGAQLLLSKGFEFGEFQGLDIIAGKVVRFPELPEREKIPNIGWSQIYPKSDASSWNETVLKNIPEKSSVYFVHSYILAPDARENILALANYGGYEFCAAVRQGNVYGCQFHPEKSGPVGIKIIENFVNLIPN